MIDKSKAIYNRKKELANTQSDLFERVALILEEARANTVRAINSQMVLAYWFIGREIVQAIQSGEERTEYRKQVLETLSKQLNQKYGAGFSVPNLQNFRKFYSTFSDRLAIQYPSGTKLSESTAPEQMHCSSDCKLFFWNWAKAFHLSPDRNTCALTNTLGNRTRTAVD